MRKSICNNNLRNKATTMKNFSWDGTTHSLGNYDNFTVGFKTSMDCSNWCFMLFGCNYCYYDIICVSNKSLDFQSISLAEISFLSDMGEA